MRRAMQETVDVVGASAAERGHRLPLRQGRHGRPGAQRGPAGAGAGRGRRGPGARVRRGRPALARARRDARADRRRPASSARRSRRTAPRSSRRSSPGAWPTRSSAAACGSTSTPRCLDIRPARRATGPSVRDPRRHRAGGRRRAGHRGLDADPARAATAPSSPCTRSWSPPSPSATTSGRAAGLERPRHLRRPPPHDHLRAAHGRRPHRLRGPGRALPLRVGRSAPASTASRRSTRCCARR